MQQLQNGGNALHDSQPIHVGTDFKFT